MRQLRYFFLFFFLLILKLADAVAKSILFVSRLPRQLFRGISLSSPRIHLPHRPRRKHSTKKTTLRTKRQTKEPGPLKLKYFLIGTLCSLLFLFLPLLFYVYLQELPDPHELSERQIPQTTKIFDRHGKLLYQIYANQNRTLVPLSQIPLTLQEATLAIEDKNFYHHPGFDIIGMIRAFHSNTSGGNFQGGSTITQQLIKSAMLTPEPSYIRKIKEVILAFWAERIYTKQQILEMYFNQVPYGGTAWGVEAASEVYFGKSVKDLDLAESAFLAGITSAPSSYSPYGPNPTYWKIRQREVLSNMVSLHDITQSQADKAASEQIAFRSPEIAIHAPHFVQYIRDLLVSRYGLAMVEKGGLSVTTSLDLSIQDQAQKIVADQVAAEEYLNLTNGAAMVTDPRNGDILAMVGSKDYYDPDGGNVNVTTSLRQPGSSIKVVTYSAALSKDYTAATLLEDTPVTYSIPGSEPYSPVNYDGKFHGLVPLRFALANSLNIPAVRTLNHVGIPTMVNLAKQMGITSWGDPSQYGLSITLGGVEVKMTDMVTVFGTLANQGERVDLNPILKITDSKGSVLEEKTQPQKTRVLDAGVTYILSDILSDNAARSMEFGPNSPLNIPGHKVSVKTGTTDYKRDNWTFGYTNNWLVGVWVGNNDNTPMSQSLASGITGAAPIWNQIMTSLLQIQPETPFTMPSNVVQKSCLGKMEYFIRGTENSGACGAIPTVQPSTAPFFKRFNFFRR